MHVSIAAAVPNRPPPNQRTSRGSDILENPRKGTPDVALEESHSHIRFAPPAELQSERGSWQRFRVLLPLRGGEEP